MALARPDPDRPLWHQARHERARRRLRFFFSSRRRHTRCSRDWSSDVCSSDLPSILILYVQSNQLSTGTATVSVAYTQAQTAGDLDIVIVSWYTASATGSVPTDKIGRASCRERV